jgi:hypothetical protein
MRNHTNALLQEKDFMTVFEIRADGSLVNPMNVVVGQSPASIAFLN